MTPDQAAEIVDMLHKMRELQSLIILQNGAIGIGVFLIGACMVLKSRRRERA